MASRVTHNVKAVCHPHDGKKTYVHVGRATTDDEGRIAVKLDTLPLTGANWLGWLNLFPVDEDRKRTAARVPGEFDDDIPF